MALRAVLLVAFAIMLVYAIAVVAVALNLVYVIAWGESQDLKDESNPSWSPDGARIAFAMGGDIYVMNVDGSERANLTDSPEEDFEPTWSPNDDLIAFLSTELQGTDIHVIRPDGSGHKNITGYPAYYLDLAWSPDGAKIAFATNRDLRQSVSSQALESRLQEDQPPVPHQPGSELYVMNADGTDQTRLTFNQVFDGNPTWSPDGTRIAFQSRIGGDYEIYLVSVDGTGLTPLTDNRYPDVLPAWSPDGQYIAFLSRRPEIEFRSELGGDWNVYIEDPDSGGLLNITKMFGMYYARPDWSPDSKYLAFEGEEPTIMSLDNNNLYAVRMEGTYELYALTDNKSMDPSMYMGPVVWSSDGESIAYLYRPATKDPHRVRVSKVVRSETAPVNLR